MHGLRFDRILCVIFVTIITIFNVPFGVVLVSSSGSEEVENYINQYKWNQDLMQNLIDDYEIVYPFQWRDRSRVGIDTRNYYYTNATIHLERCTFVIKSSYGRFKLHVELNKNLFPPQATFKFNVNSTTQTATKGQTMEHCFYQGFVQNENNSKVILSTCSGLQGAIIINNHTYFLVPMQGGDMGKRHPHVLIRGKWHQKLNCGNTGLTEWNNQLEQKQSFSRRHHKRDVSTETKYVELALVIDYAAFSYMNLDNKQFTQFLLEIVNGVDMIFYDSFRTHVSLVYMETWQYNSPRNFMQASEDITQTLLDFIQYVSKHMYADLKDVTILISGTKFLRQEISMASSGNICTAKSSGVVQILDRFESFRSSVVIAHNVAHVLGVRHDDETKSIELLPRLCECADKSGCIMTKTISIKRNKFATEFSTCSSQDYTNMLRTGLGTCLFNKPLEENALKLCGNKKVDPGEQCDCGTLDECDTVDPCCDPVTCTLRKDAECGAGLCCDSCKIVKNGPICRISTGECDVPEICDGISGKCPENAHKLDGSVCGEFSDGYCYLGKCQTLSKQCQALWGSDSQVAEQQCFEKMNLANLEPGIAKTVGNAMCSYLQCRGGREIPTLPIYSKTEFAEHRKVYECKTASSGNKSASENEGLVKDGTKCLNNRICVDNLCVHLNTVTVDPKCPSNHVAWPCSGHGVCTNLNWCHCNEGWSGHDCSIKLALPSITTRLTSKITRPLTSTISSRFVILRNSTLNIETVFGRSFPFFVRLDTYAMLFILGGVAAGVLLLLLILALCYRRRTSSMSRKKKLSSKMMTSPTKKDIDRYSESSIDTAHRSIRFGDMPSYRDEKVQIKRKKQQQRIMQHINNISGGTSDLDSIKSKESFNNLNIDQQEMLDDDAQNPEDQSYEVDDDIVDQDDHRGDLDSSQQQSADLYSSNKLTCDDLYSCQRPPAIDLYFQQQQQNDLSYPQRFPERGILKNGVNLPAISGRKESSDQSTPTVDNGHRYGVTTGNGVGQKVKSPTMVIGGDGYESEPSYPAFRVFEQSMRQLNECDPYLNTTCRRRLSNQRESETDCVPAYTTTFNNSVPVTRRGGHGSLLRGVPHPSCGDGCCLNNAAALAGSPPSQDLKKSCLISGTNSFAPTAANSFAPSPSHCTHSNNKIIGCCDATTNSSFLNVDNSQHSHKCNSVDSHFSPVDIDFHDAEPLKLQNIEYLLKQLDKSHPTSNSSSLIIDDQKQREGLLDNGDDELDDGRDESEAFLKQKNFDRSETDQSESSVCKPPHQHYNHHQSHYSSAYHRHVTNNFSAVDQSAAAAVVYVKQHHRYPPYTHDLNSSTVNVCSAGAVAGSTTNRRPVKLNSSNATTTSSSAILSDRNTQQVRLQYAGSKQQQPENHICSSCQLPTPDLSCDGRTSSDGSCDNNVCLCNIPATNIINDVNI